MIYSVSLNPCTDKTASIARIDLDAPNRIGVERTDLGGKGVNVARAIRALGGESMVVGFDYRGHPVAGAMAGEKVPCHLVALPGELRVNLKLKETETGRTIEISERGAEASEAALQSVLDALLSLIRPGEWVTLSGSLPVGAPADTYAQFCRAVQARGGFAAADCDGAALKCVLDAHPALIKPNAQEFEALTGVNPGDVRAALRACRDLLARGVGKVCLSQGGEGALLADVKDAWFCPAARVTAQGTQGAGDTLLGALLLGMNRGMGSPEALRFAVAAAGASVMRPGTLLCRREDAETLLESLPAAQKLE